MAKKKLVYIMSPRNAAADQAGQQIAYKGGWRYMKSPLEYLAQALGDSALGDAYSLEGILYDDDEQSARDRQALGEYGFACQDGKTSRGLELEALLQPLACANPTVAYSWAAKAEVTKSSRVSQIGNGVR